MMLTLPLTRGSGTELRPVISETALTTASMSALTKLSVTGSSAARAAGISATVRVTTSKAAKATAHNPRPKLRRRPPGWMSLESLVGNRLDGSKIDRDPPGVSARGKLHESARAAGFHGDRAFYGIIARAPRGFRERNEKSKRGSPRIEAMDLHVDGMKRSTAQGPSRF